MDRDRGVGEPPELRRVSLQRFRVPAHLLVLAEELEEDGDLRLQDGGVDGRRDVVDRAERVAARGAFLVAVGGDEDDRRVLRALALADQLRGLEAVHVGHVDVEEDQRELAAQEPAQGVAAGRGLHDVDADLAEHDREREPLLGPVVDEEDGCVRFAHAGTYRSSHARRTESIRSGSTGFER